MEVSLEEKQKYLRENILESGYDPSDFVQFLETHENIDQVDIEGWSMKQIEHLVGVYKQYKYYTQESSSQLSKPKEQGEGSEKLISESKMEIQKEKINFVEQNKNKICYVLFQLSKPRYVPLFDYEFKAQYKCVQADNLLKEPALEVSVPKYELIDSEGIFLGFGSKTEVWFSLKTNMKEGMAKRVMQDFEWLSSILIRLYPFLALPQLSQFRKDGEFANERRRIEIQEFLQHLAKKAELLKSSLFIDFLTVNKDKMAKLKKNYESMGFARGVSLLKTDSGEVEVELTKKNMAFQEAAFQYSRKVLQVHEGLESTISKAIESFTEVIDNMNRIVDYFADLHQLYNDLMNRHPEQKNKSYNEMLINMNNLFHGVSDNLKSHSNNIDKHLRDYFKFNILSDKNVIRLEKYIKEEEKHYLEYKYNLYRKKERLISEPEKWDIDLKAINYHELKTNKEKAFPLMLPRETFQESQIKSWVAFLYSNFEKEFKSHISNQTVRYAQKFKIFATDLLSKDKNYLESLTKFIHESRKFEHYS